MNFDTTISIKMPAIQIPSFRTMKAIEAGKEKNILIKTWGGIGDQICSEPTIRWALRTFRDCKISLASELPELFSHLKFERVYDLRDHMPIYENFLVFETIRHQSDLTWEFMSHMLVNCVDYVSLCMFRCQIPNDEKNVLLVPGESDQTFIDGNLERWGFSERKWAVVHAGRHWPVKTFPVEWWNAVLVFLKERDITPVLIGGDSDDNRGTVDVDASDCIDLRNHLTLMQSVALLKRASVLITNDSSPIHMASPSECYVGLIATCKHPDYLMHWRGPQKEFGWRMENLGVDGVWNHMDYLPNKEDAIEVDKVDERTLMSYIPSPIDVANYAEDACRLLPPRKMREEDVRDSCH